MRRGSEKHGRVDNRGTAHNHIGALGDHTWHRDAFRESSRGEIEYELPYLLGRKDKAGDLVSVVLG